MKKVIALILALVLALSVVGCGAKTSIETLVSQADIIVQNYQPLTDAAYAFAGEYLEEDMSYVIMMYIDIEALDAALADANPKYVDTIRQIGIQNLDSDTEVITADLAILHSSVASIFKGTEVVIAAGYIDFDGNVTRYY